MDIRKVDGLNRPDMEFVERIYIESFPRNERRPIFELNHLAQNENLFSVYLIQDNDTKIGFLTCWSFQSFIFLEHFAIDSNIRGSGYGQKTLTCIQEMFKLPIILEVEKPDTDIAKRRIDFYIRQGFTLSEQIYEQPPYEEEFDFIPMNIMSYGFSDLDRCFKDIKIDIYKKVYKLDVK